VQPVAPLKFFNHMVLGKLRRCHRRYRVMSAGIKRLSDSCDGLNPEFRQHSHQLFESQIYPLNKTLLVIVIPVVLGGLYSSFETVDNRQQFLENLFAAIANLISLIPLDQTFVILELGSQA